MILPDPIDPQIGPRVAFPGESRSFKEFRRGFIMRQARGFDPVQTERGESVHGNCPDRGGHYALPGVWRAGPISKRCRLHNTALDLPESQASRQHIIVTKDQERVGFIAGDFLMVSLNPAPERGAG